jgi:hypothetical protein
LTGLLGRGVLECRAAVSKVAVAGDIVIECDSVAIVAIGITIVAIVTIITIGITIVAIVAIVTIITIVSIVTVVSIVIAIGASWESTYGVHVRQCYCGSS